MLKILYAANNNYNSSIQLSRFVHFSKNEPYKIKIAAYKKSSSPNLNIDWTLDCLLNVLDGSEHLINNDNFKIFFDQVRYFSPNLIISDLEFFTSQISAILNIPIWQCNSSLINHAITQEVKQTIGFFKRYGFLNDSIKSDPKTINIITNANKNFVYSHLGDVNNSPQLLNNFEWIRPYYLEGKISKPCQHNLVGGVLQNNSKIISLMKNYEDSILFTNLYEEIYKNLKLKNIDNIEEYACNLKNSQLFVCGGHTNFLADAYYNNKYSIIIPDFNDPECILNGLLSEAFKLGINIFNSSEDINHLKDAAIQINKKENIKLLHEKINEVFLK